MNSVAQSERSRTQGLRVRRLMIAAMLLAALVVTSQTLADVGGGPDWGMIGKDAANSRDQPFEHVIGPADVGRLAPKWVATTAGDVSATPAVVGGAVYFPDFGGMLWKLDAQTGAVIWSHSIAGYTGIAGDTSRTSPVLAGNTLVIGDLKHPDMLGIDATTGQLRWITQIEPDARGIITASPTIAGDTVLVGVSAAGAGPGSPNCCTFRGSLVALRAQTGAILWRTYSVPDNGGVPGGYAGGTIIAPPAVDLSTGLVYATYGNPYTEPAGVVACNAASPHGFSESCEQPGSHFKSLVAFDLRTGAVRWAYRVQGDDPWQRACGGLPASVTWCQPESDLVAWDFGGSGPNVFQIGTRDVVGVGEKSGVYVVLDAKTGAFAWNTLVGPGADLGGMEWGTATDGSRIYVSIGNENHVLYHLTPSGGSATGGSWAALDAATGRIDWQTPDPAGALDLAPVTVANGVVYAASMAKSGNEMFALDAATGAILWQFSAGSSVIAGPAVVNGTIYWGSGYSRLGPAIGNGNDKLYAFSIDGR
jgi:polyvinyl alcohol dehydrogenase (cytochrome)